jgi:hypothetical protein
VRLVSQRLQLPLQGRLLLCLLLRLQQPMQGRLLALRQSLLRQLQSLFSWEQGLQEPWEDSGAFSGQPRILQGELTWWMKRAGEV